LCPPQEAGFTLNLIVPVFFDNGAVYMGDLWVAHEILTSLPAGSLQKQEWKSKDFSRSRKTKPGMTLLVDPCLAW
jgi:hypothetical protein